MTLVEFLLARIAEDEAVALKPDDDGPLDSWHTRECSVHPQSHERTWCNCDVPARVLAECEAKRTIVTACETAAPRGTSGLWPAVLSNLAAPYADHPDYDPTWRP